MLPGNVDPRRADKQQRYKPPPSSNNAAPGEDLTPDYMNILDSQKKSMHSSNRSDRFKVVKIESTEPFKRGRWECMDFLDQSYNRIFQHNSVAYKSSDTNVQPSLNSSRMEPPKSTSHSSWGSNIDLQSSMLQIFYRQNNSIANNDTNKELCLSQRPSTQVPTQNAAAKTATTYRNHVLRPGMVTSSLVGIKYPLELNFVMNEDAIDTCQLTVNGALPLKADLHLSLPRKQVCACKNSTDIPNQLYNVEQMQDLGERQLVIQNDLQVPTHPKFNCVQQNYSVQNGGDFIYQNANGLTLNPPLCHNLTSPRIPECPNQEQSNACQFTNMRDVHELLPVPSTTQTTEFYQIEPNAWNNSPDVSYIMYPACSNVKYEEQRSNVVAAVHSTSNLPQLPKLPPLQSPRTSDSNRCHSRSDLRLTNGISEHDMSRMAVTQNCTSEQSTQTLIPINQKCPMNMHSCTTIHLINTNVPSKTELNGSNQEPIACGPNSYMINLPDSISVDGPVFNQPFVLPLLTSQYHIPICVPTHNTGNNAMPKNAPPSTTDGTIPKGYVLVPHSINSQATVPAASPSAHPQLPEEPCAHSVPAEYEQAHKEPLPRTIDTKIEALMDLVKKHLKVAVLEDVNVLKQRIMMLKERIAQLEYENELLKRCDCANNYKNNI